MYACINKIIYIYIYTHELLYCLITALLVVFVRLAVGPRDLLKLCVMLLYNIP